MNDPETSTADISPQLRRTVSAAGRRPTPIRFTLNALDVPSIALESGTREELEAKIDAHVLGSARLIGRYQRQRTGATSR